MTQSPNSIIRYPPWLIVAVDMMSTLGLAAAVYFWLNDRRMTAVGLGFFGLLALVAVVDMGVSRISLEADALRVVSLFSTKRYERHDIERVTWEGGSGVAIQMKDGTWVKLPDLGRNSQSTTNTIRAWLKRQ